MHIDSEYLAVALQTSDDLKRRVPLAERLDADENAHIISGPQRSFALHLTVIFNV